MIARGWSTIVTYLETGKAMHNDSEERIWPCFASAVSIAFHSTTQAETTISNTCVYFTMSPHFSNTLTRVASIRGAQEHTNFRHKGVVTQPCGANKNEHAVWVDCWIAGSVSLSGLRLTAGGSSVWAHRPGHGIQSTYAEEQLDRALDVLLRMDQQGTVPSVNAYQALLKACTKWKDLVQAKAVYAHLMQHGFDSSRLLGEYAVSTLVKCGGLDDAVQVFQRMPHRTAFSWTAIISGYTSADQGQEAMRLYDCMLREGLEPNTYTLASLLKDCGKRADLEDGKRVHADVLKYRCESDLFVGTSLVDMYAKCGSIVDAEIVFDGLPYRDVVLWNAMLGGYAQPDEAEKAVQLYRMMQEEGVSPNDRTFVSLLLACGMLAESEEACIVNGRYIKVKSLQRGIVVHTEAWRQGYDSDLFVGNTLVSMYGKCGSIVDANKVFHRLSNRDVVSWASMLAAYGQNGQADNALKLYDQMLEDGISPDVRIVVGAIQACGMLGEKEEKTGSDGIRVQTVKKGKALQALVQRKGYASTSVVGNTLISMFGKCGCAVDAQNVFDQLCHRDVVSWTAMVGAYAQQGHAEKAMKVYRQMMEEGLSPDTRTFVSALQACGMLAEQEGDGLGGGSTKLNSLGIGKAVHADLHKKRYNLDIFIGNALVTMYAKCGSILDAQNVFDGLCHRDVVSWTAMLTANAQQGQAEKAMELYEQMWDEGLSPNDVTFVSALQACGLLADKEEAVIVDRQFTKLKALERGRSVHADSERKGYGTNVLVANTLISMYGDCGSIEDAQNVFNRLSVRSVVAWTAMIAAHAKQGHADKALDVLRQMQAEGVSPNEISLVSILQVCSSSGGLSVCRHIHQSMFPTNLDSTSLPLATSLIHAYGKCASMVDAQAVFDALALEPDVVTWTALIAGYARQGNCVASLQCFEEMQLAGQKPNGVTFLSLLYACSHAGLVERGVEYFESMSRDHGINPEIEHYTCMVDLIGRTGYFTAVEQILSTMPKQADLAMWLCLLSACRKHGKVALGRQAFDSAICIEPKHAATYVLMWNIYADAGLWEQAKEVKELRKQESAWKKPGQSWIEHKDLIHVFVVEDCEHSQQEQLFSMLGQVGLKVEWDVLQEERNKDLVCNPRTSYKSVGLASTNSDVGPH